MFTPIIVDSKSYSLNFSFKSYSSSSRRLDVIARTILELIWLKERLMRSLLSNVVYVVLKEDTFYSVFQVNIGNIPKMYLKNEYSFLLCLTKHKKLNKVPLEKVLQLIKGNTVIHLTEKGVDIEEVSKAKVLNKTLERIIILLGGHRDVPRDFLEKAHDLAFEVLNVSIGSRSYLASHAIIFLLYFLYLRFKNLAMK